jgi:predicted glycoside hydrolase/deacetylase ChbG (UPF0249 family)
MAERKLIVNADDFGQSDEINNGVIQSFEKGILTSASLMVRYPAAAAAAEYALKNNLGLGLHVDLGEWFFENNEWLPLYEVVSTNDTNAVKDEIHRQLDSFIKLTGMSPTHLDSHQHVHNRKNLLPLFIEMAKMLNVTLRSNSEHVKYCGDFYGQLSDAKPQHDSISVKNLNKIITELKKGITEMACHPGISVKIKTMYKEERDLEVSALCDSSVRKTLKDSDVELSSFVGIPF